MRFSIRFTVDELALGPALAALNSHDGVVFDHLAIEPLTPPRPAPKPAPCQNDWARQQLKAKDQRPQTGREIVLQLLAAEGPQSYSQIKAVLTSRGFAAGGVGSLINNKMSRTYGEIESLKPGVWALAKSKGN